jgi:catechol 2,3-dioxygenase-like lactoylglutathione lyase family enzyme
MRLHHLALAVQDRERSIAFYARYFRFDPASARTYPDGVAIVRDPDGFALALGVERRLDRGSRTSGSTWRPRRPENSWRG